MSHGFTPRQVRLLWSMYNNKGKITCKDQDVWLSISLFYTQINRLIKFGFVKGVKNSHEHYITYVLTRKGRCLASHLQEMAEYKAPLI